MASRLSVLMIQSKPPTPSAQRMADEVVGNLIGAGGLDLMLIAPPASLAETATDRLTLETLTGDVAVLDWQDPERIVLSLASVNFRGHRTPHPHDLDATLAATSSPAVASSPAAAAPRRVFAFDLRRFAGSRELIDALQELNSRRQVRTFGIGIVSRIPQADADQRKAPSAQLPATDQADTVSGAERTGPPLRQSSSQATVQPAGKEVRPAGALDLDELLDQLEQADP
jgi:hypothetical protein